MAGTPSGPGAALALSSEHAFSMSAGLNTRLSNMFGSSPEEGVKNSSGSSTDHSFRGVENTPSYCFLKLSAANSGQEFDLPVEGSRKGPIFALSFALDLQKEKKARGFCLILNTAASSSILLEAM